MYAVLGIPGSIHHSYFHGTLSECQARLDQAWKDLQINHPAAFPLPTQLISDRAARRQRYRDGTKIYK